MGGTDASEVSWRAELADKLSWATMIALSIASLISYAATVTSPRVTGLTVYVLVPMLLLIALERVVAPRDYRVRAWVTIGSLVLVGIAASTTVGLIGGAASALFLALILSSLMLGQRAMLGLLAFVAISVGTTAWLMVTGRIDPPIPEDVSFTNPTTWFRTAGNTLVLLGLGAIVTAQVVGQLERALTRVRTEAAERERAQEDRAHALELALQSQKVEVVGRLAAGLAHDLNNALFVIDACNQILLRGKQGDAERLETHTAIAEAVKQSSAMARQLLSFARKHVVSPVSISTRDLVDELQRGVTRLFPADIRVSVVCEEDVTVRADKVHLQQAILNLAINARDAMSNGGELSVRTGTAQIVVPCPAIGGEIPVGRYATFEVRDTGTGMDDETLIRAFEPLYTTKPEGKGTGLGLASVLSIVEMSGGHVTLSSELGRGTTITLYLPIAESVPRLTPVPSDAAPILDLHGTTVLLAEDSPDVRAVISSSLKQHGCTVLQARDGTDALLHIERASVIDVLCTDAVMPGAPVREVIALLKRRHPEADVVVISGYVTDELTRRGIEQGHFRVLAKPFEPHRLLETIDELRRAPAAKRQEPAQSMA